MTPRQFYRAMVVAKERREAEHDRDITLAWSIAALTRGSKGLPKLEQLLTRATRRRQSLQEMRAMMDAISTAYKLPLRKRKKQAHGQ